MPQVPIKREIRPSTYIMDIRKQPGGDLELVLIHPMEADAYIYRIDDKGRKQLHEATSESGIITAPASAIPPEKLH